MSIRELNVLIVGDPKSGKKTLAQHMRSEDEGLVAKGVHLFKSFLPADHVVTTVYHEDTEKQLTLTMHVASSEAVDFEYPKNVDAIWITLNGKDYSKDALKQSTDDFLGELNRRYQNLPPIIYVVTHSDTFPSKLELGICLRTLRRNFGENNCTVSTNNLLHSTITKVTNKVTQKKYAVIPKARGVLEEVPMNYPPLFQLKHSRQKRAEHLAVYLTGEKSKKVLIHNEVTLLLMHRQSIYLTHPQSDLLRRIDERIINQLQMNCMIDVEPRSRTDTIQYLLRKSAHADYFNAFIKSPEEKCILQLLTYLNNKECSFFEYKARSKTWKTNYVEVEFQAILNDVELILQFSDVEKERVANQRTPSEPLGDFNEFIDALLTKYKSKKHVLAILKTYQAEKPQEIQQVLN